MGGLRNGHEIADNALVGNGDRAAFLDLAAEEGHHRPIGTQHVAKADGRELGCLAVAALDHHLAQALGRPHHVGGVDRLVGGNQHKAPGAVFLGCYGGVIGAEHIVVDGFRAVVLHQRHMLVRGGVEDHLGPKALEHLMDAVVVTHRGDDGLHVERFAVAALQFLLQVIDGVFIHIQQHQQLGLGFGQLPAQFTADGAAGTSDHHRLALVEGLHVLVLQGNRLAEQQILNIDVAHQALVLRQA